MSTGKRVTRKKTKPTKKLGRPSKLTPALQQEICAYIAQDDMYAVIACALAGVTEPTYYAWKKRGQDGEEPYADFLKSVKEAEATAELLLSRDMRKDPKHWQMYMTIKERRFSSRWAKQERVQQEHSGGLEVILKVSEANGNGNAPKK